MNQEDFKGINTDKAKAQFEDRIRQQNEHLEKTFGPMRDSIEAAATDHELNFAVLNFTMTIHDLSKYHGMDLLNQVQKYMSVHYNSFEAKVRKIVDLVGEERIQEELGINVGELYPTEYCIKGLKEVQRAAQERARMGKYGIELETPKKIEV